MALSSPISHFYTNYPSSYNYKCPFCHYSVEFLYPGRKRVIKDFNGNFSETRYLYRCTNETCYNHSHPFNPTPKFTLSNKRYSFSVWKWIGRESKSYNMNASKIHKRIQDEFEMSISENTIRNITDEKAISCSSSYRSCYSQLIPFTGQPVTCCLHFKKCIITFTY